MKNRINTAEIDAILDGILYEAPRGSRTPFSWGNVGWGEHLGGLNAGRRIQPVRV